MVVGAERVLGARVGFGTQAVEYENIALVNVLCFNFTVSFSPTEMRVAMPSPQTQTETIDELELKSRDALMRRDWRLGLDLARQMLDKLAADPGRSARALRKARSLLNEADTQIGTSDNVMSGICACLIGRTWRLGDDLAGTAKSWGRIAAALLPRDSEWWEFNQQVTSGSTPRHKLVSPALPD